MRSTHLASAFYLLYFGAAGSLFPYLNLFYQQIGIDTRRISVLAVILTSSILFAGPMWAAIADIFHVHKRLLPLAMMATLPPVLLLTVFTNFWTLVVVVFFLAICLSPIIPLADNAVLTLLGDRRYEYGKLRVWGAVGWGLSALGTGILSEHQGIRWVFVVYLCLMSMGTLVALRLPAPHLATSEPYWVTLRRFAVERRWVGFLVSIALFGSGLAFVSQYLVLYFHDLGGGEGLFGLAVAVASLSELPVFALSSAALRRWSPRGLIPFAMVALTLRCFLYSIIRNPALVVGVQLLHGPSFSAMWAAGVSHANELAPPGLGASAQSLFSATVYGLAGAVGTLVGGQLYAAVGPATLFQLAGLVTVGGLVVFGATEFAFGRRQRSTQVAK